MYFGGFAVLSSQKIIGSPHRKDLYCPHVANPQIATFAEGRKFAVFQFAELICGPPQLWLRPCSRYAAKMQVIYCFNYVCKSIQKAAADDLQRVGCRTICILCINTLGILYCDAASRAVEFPCPRINTRERHNQGAPVLKKGCDTNGINCVEYKSRQGLSIL